MDRSLLFLLLGVEALSERVERKLTAILAVDMAGYSRLMDRDEEGTLATSQVGQSTMHFGHSVENPVHCPK
jgi:hypothetical protein